MAEEVRVTTSQVDAARLIVERDSANGKSTPEAIRKIASAQVEPPPEAASSLTPPATAGAGKKRRLRAALARAPWRRGTSGVGSANGTAGLP
jgi:hypothetical protein